MALVGEGRDFFGQPALPDSRLPLEEDHLGAAPFERHLYRTVEKTELRLAADHRAAHPAGPPPRRRYGFERNPRVDALLAAPRGHKTQGFVVNDVGGDRVSGLPDQDGARGRGLLQALRGVHDVAHGGVIPTGAQRPHENFSRVHADAHLDVTTVGSLDFGERALHPQGGAHGALRVVAVGDRCTEQGDDGITDDLVDAATERDHIGDEQLETAVDERLHLLGIE